MIEELNKALILAVLKTPLKQILDGSLFYFLVDTEGYSNSHQKNISNKKRLDKLAVFQVEIKIYVDPLEDSFTMKTIVKEYKRLSLEEVNKAIVLEEL